MTAWEVMLLKIIPKLSEPKKLILSLPMQIKFQFQVAKEEILLRLMVKTQQFREIQGMIIFLSAQLQKK